MWLTTAVLILIFVPGSRAADKAASLVGRWTLDRDHSQMPDEVGFDMAVETVTESPANANATRGRGRGGRSDGSGGVSVAPEGEQTLKILADVTDEAQHPWPVLVITETKDVVTISDGGTVTRTFHPGKDDEQRLVDGGIDTHTKWDSTALVVDYEIEKNRDVRYRYSRLSASAPLVVELSFRDHGRGAPVTRVYSKGQ